MRVSLKSVDESHDIQPFILSTAATKLFPKITYAL